MKKCYIAVGGASCRSLFWYKYDLKACSREENIESDRRFLYVDINEETEKDLGREKSSFIMLNQEVSSKSEGAEKEIIERVAGRKKSSKMAEYARKFEPFIDEFFNTEDLELIFLACPLGSFLHGAAFDIIDFVLTKIAFTYPDTKIHTRTLVFSDEFTIDGIWDPIADRFALTKFFLDRYVAEKSKWSRFCVQDELYIIDSELYTMDEQVKMIGFTSEQLEKFDKKTVCMAESLKRNVNLLKLERNDFGWKS